MWFWKKKPECEHEYEIIKNDDFYDPDTVHEPFKHFSEKFFTPQTKIVFPDEFLEILKDKNIDEKKMADKIINSLENVYQKEYENKVKELINSFRKTGHVVIQRCKKCGKITKDITWYTPIYHGPNSVMESFFGKGN